MSSNSKGANKNESKARNNKVANKTAKKHSAEEQETQGGTSHTHTTPTTN